MQTAPAVSTPLGSSWVYRCVAVLVAILLGAAYAGFIWSSAVFSPKNLLLGGLSVLAGAWLLADAFGKRPGALHYAAGQWVLALGDKEYAGTIAPKLDLQHYLLVSFSADSPMNDNNKTPGTSLGNRPGKSTWLHLERRNARHLQDWLALRRAVFARVQRPVFSSAE